MNASSHKIIEPVPDCIKSGVYLRVIQKSGAITTISGSNESK